jgi:hypothetical protein
MNVQIKILCILGICFCLINCSKVDFLQEQSSSSTSSPGITAVKPSIDFPRIKYNSMTPFLGGIVKISSAQTTKPETRYNKNIQSGVGELILSFDQLSSDRPLKVYEVNVIDTDGNKAEIENLKQLTDGDLNTYLLLHPKNYFFHFKLNKDIGLKSIEILFENKLSELPHDLRAYDRNAKNLRLLLTALSMHDSRMLGYKKIEYKKKQVIVFKIEFNHQKCEQAQVRNYEGECILVSQYCSDFSEKQKKGREQKCQLFLDGELRLCQPVSDETECRQSYQSICQVAQAYLEHEYQLSEILYNQDKLKSEVCHKSE